MIHRSACTLFAVLLSLGAAPLKEEPAKKVPAELQGRWKLVKLEINGRDSDYIKDEPRWIVKGDKVRYGGEDLATLTADATTAPRSIDFAFLAPKKAIEGIYTIEKDTLKICINARPEGVKERPQDFATEDKQHLRLLVFQRDAKEGDEREGCNAFVGMQLRKDADKGEIVILSTIENSPAKKADLQKDDVILKVNGGDAAELPVVIDMIRQLKPGAEVVLRIRRDGKEKDVKVKAGVFPFAFLVGLE